MGSYECGCKFTSLGARVATPTSTKVKSRIWLSEGLLADLNTRYAAGVNAPGRPAAQGHRHLSSAQIHSPQSDSLSREVLASYISAQAKFKMHTSETLK